MRADFSPVRGHQNENGQPPFAEVLLIPEVLIGGHDGFKACGFRGTQEIAVLFLAPAALIGGRNLVEGQCPA